MNEHTNDDWDLGWSSGIWMYRSVKVYEVLWLVLQIHYLLVEVELLLQQSDPGTLCKRAPANRDDVRNDSSDTTTTH